MEMEIWKPIKGLEKEGYEISTLGNARKKLKNGNYRPLKPYNTGSGYDKLNFRITDEHGNRISADKWHRQRCVHQLVAEAFLNYDVDSGLEIDHINHNKKDNRLGNLRIVTRSENCKHGCGYKIKITPVVGVRISDGEVFRFKSIAKAEEATGATSIRACLNGTYNSSGNYFWFDEAEYDKKVQAE